jgi:hypothetical protein
MKIRLLVPMAVLGFSAAACAGQTAQLSVTPAAGVVAAVAGATCDAGAWQTGGISVEGRPDRFDAGDRGATYLWHDSSGWHLRTTDQTDKAHVYSGRIALSAGGFTGVQGVSLERGDRYQVDGRNLYYRFVTYRGVDGLDFHLAGCSPAAPEELAFRLRYDRALDANRVIVGDRGRHPKSDPFTVVRSL